MSSGAAENLRRVNKAHDAVEPDAISEPCVQKGRGYSRRLGDAACFEHDVFRSLHPFDRAMDGPEQVVTDVAANASVGEADDVAAALDAEHEFSVDVDRAEVVYQHGHAQAVIALQNAVEEGRLAGAKKAGEDGDGDRDGWPLAHAAWFLSSWS
jgi:hypothetical protein